MGRPPEFRILANASDGRAEITVEGELDMATAPQLRAEFERVAAIDGLELVLVDLRRLQFIDSTGLEAILRFESAARGDGVELAVVRGPRAGERLLSVMQLDRRLRIVDDPAEL